MSHNEYGSFGSPYYYGGPYGQGFFDYIYSGDPNTIVQTISDFYPTWMKPELERYKSWPMPKELIYDLSYTTSFNIYMGRIGEPFYADNPREYYNYYTRLTYYQWVTTDAFLYNDTRRRFNIIIGYNRLNFVNGDGNIHIGRNIGTYSYLNTNYSINLGNEIEPIKDVFTLKTNPNHGILTISPPKEKTDVYEIDAYNNNTFIYDDIINEWINVNLYYKNLNESITDSNVRMDSSTQNITGSDMTIDSTDIYQKNLNESITSSNIRIHSTTQNISSSNIKIDTVNQTLSVSNIYEYQSNESITKSTIKIDSTTQNISSCTILLSSSTFDVIDSNIDIKNNSNLELTSNSNLQLTLNSNLQLENTNAKLTNQTIALGTSAVSDRDGMYSVMHNGFENAGDAQRSQFLLYGKSTSNTLTEIFCDGYGGNKRMTIPTDKAWSGIVNILGVQSDGSYVARYLRQVTIENDNGSVSLVGSVITLGTDVQPSLGLGITTEIEITADNTNKSLKIRCRGLNTTWRWIASAEGVELTIGS